MADNAVMDVKMNYEKIRPHLNIVLVKLDQVATMTKHGLYLGVDPERQEYFRKGTVVRVGPGSRNLEGHHVEMGIKVGDRVLVPQNTGARLDEKKIQAGENMHVMLPDKDIYGILEEGAEPKGSKEAPQKRPEGKIIVPPPGLNFGKPAAGPSKMTVNPGPG